MNLPSPSFVTRRRFLSQLPVLAGAASAAGRLGAADPGPAPLPLSSNAYSWQVFYQREGRDFGKEMDAALGDLVASGLTGLEPGVGGVAELDALVPLLRKHGLTMPSLYTGSTLHVAAEVERNVDQVVAIARRAKEAGTRIVVTNPSPLQWGGTLNKDDAQLRVQAEALNELGRRLRELGMTLAYHNHDMEMRQAAREFHHMMVGTDPARVSLCLDAHWIYRGSGNSAVALFDVVRLYGARVAEVHLRQSREGVWSETLGAGDIDYAALAQALGKQGAKPLLVMEIAVEQGTPKTLSPVEAHRRSAEYARQVFAGLAG